MTTIDPDLSEVNDHAAEFPIDDLKVLATTLNAIFRAGLTVH